MFDQTFHYGHLATAMLVGSTLGVIVMALLSAARMPEDVHFINPLERLAMSKNATNLDPETVAELVEAFLNYRPGDSFFVPNVKPSELEPLTKAFKDAGAGYELASLRRDEIYQCSGTRVWRREGPYDKL